VVLEYMPENIVSGRACIVMAYHECTALKDRLEEILVVLEFIFTSFANYWVDFTPHVGDDDVVLRGWLTAEFSEHSEVFR